jgi:imidazolonepropionase
MVHGGNRAREFEQRLQGVSYSDIARAGGGIMSTVNATREASDEQMLFDALTRVDALLAEGVGTLEIKSGYGLDEDTELRMLRIARQVAEQRNITVRTSFLGAHALPPEYAGRAEAYLDEVCLPTLKKAHAEGLVDAVDGFCENIAFSKEQMQKVFDAATALKLPVKLHAEQLSDQGGSAMAAGYGALSADHLEYLDQAGVDAMAASGTVAVLLPGAFYCLSETKLPPVEALRTANVPIAIATDYNPGSSPLCSLLLAMNMGCTLFKLTPEEALTGATRHAAQALGLDDRGEISVGKRADFAIWDVQEPAELSYRIGANPLHARLHGISS